MAKFNLNPSNWNTQIPIQKECLMMMGVAALSVVLTVSLMLGPWYTFDSISKDKEDGYENGVIMNFKLHGMGFEEKEEDENGKDGGKGTVSYGSDFALKLDEIVNVVLYTKIITYLTLVTSLTLLAMAIFSMVHSDKNYTGKLMLFSGVALAILPLASALLFAFMMPGAIDEAWKDESSDTGFFESIEADQSLYGSKEDDNEYYKTETRWHPAWGWYIALIGMPALGGLAAFVSLKLKKSGTQAGTTLTQVTEQPATVTSDWGATQPQVQQDPYQQQQAAYAAQQQAAAAQQQAAYQQQPQAAAQPQQQYQVVWAQCPYCQQQQQAYSTGQPQQLQCQHCQNQYTATV